jgi:uncharacterized membrane protein YvbJ
MSFFLSLLSGVWSKVVIVGAVVLTVILLFLRVKNAGKVEERARQMEIINEAVKESRKREITTSSLPEPELDRRMREQRDQLRKLLQSR